MNALNPASEAGKMLINRRLVLSVNPLVHAQRRPASQGVVLWLIGQ